MAFFFQSYIKDLLGFRTHKCGKTQWYALGSMHIGSISCPLTFPLKYNNRGLFHKPLSTYTMLSTMLKWQLSAHLYRKPWSSTFLKASDQTVDCLIGSETKALQTKTLCFSLKLILRQLCLLALTNVHCTTSPISLKAPMSAAQYA